MKKYFYFYSIALLIYFCTSNLQAQKLIVSGFDYSQYPIIKANVVALDAFNNSYTNLTATDFDVLENLKSKAASLSFTCSNVLQDLAITLIVDVSKSMGDPIDTLNPNPNETKAKWVQKGISSFFGGLNFVGKTYVSLITFSNTVQLSVPFTKDTSKLSDSLRKTMLVGTRRYDPPFWDTINGAFNLYRKLPDSLRDCKRVIIFITDGETDPQPDATKIIDECNKLNTQVYSISVQNPISKSLTMISDRTGGKSFEILNINDLDKIYRVIVAEILQRSVCQLKWMSDFTCDDKSLIRDVEIHLKKGTTNYNTVKKSYTAPPNSVFKLVPESQKIYFGYPSLGQEVIKNIKVKVKNSPFVFKSIKLDSIFEIKSIKYNNKNINNNDTIPIDSNIEISISYIQKASNIVLKSNLSIYGTPCEFINLITLEANTADTYIIENEISNFSIYPNPSSDYLNIKLNYEPLDNEEVSIIDMFGQNILTQNIKSIETNIKLTNFQSGIYYAKFKNRSEVLKFEVVK